MPGRDVFISHRGPDTKNGFVSMLAERLESVGITVFYEKKDLRPAAEKTAWDVMKANLRAAEVQVAYVLVGLKLFVTQGSLLVASLFEFSWQIGVFSENYLLSEWCKEELQIMNETPEKIMPIFYGVGTSGFGAASGKAGFKYNPKFE